MVSRKAPTVSFIFKIDVPNVKKHHGPRTCEIDFQYFNSTIENGQNLNYESLMARLSVNIC